MNNGLKGVLIFAVGTVTGGVMVWLALDKRYRDIYAKIADEEIDSVKKAFRKPVESEPQVPVNVAQNNADICSYRKIVQQKYESESMSLDDDRYVIRDEYRDISGNPSATVFELPQRNLTIGPYIITPDDFGSELGYDSITLSYYADGVLADDLDEPVTDITDTIGEDAIEHLGEYADDALFVRNEKYRVDYEILRDLRKYSDVVQRDYPTED